MQAFELGELLHGKEGQEARYREFLRVPQLSMGLYTLPAGADDPQQPHGEDEVYYVVSGQATINVGGEERRVRPGSIVYVPAEEPHHFHHIEADLSVLVFFAPAESAESSQDE